MKNEWFDQARFGMFIHWGPYSLHGRCVWARYRERIPSSEYAKLAWKFDAKNYRPEEWVDIAQEAGMKYMVVCTRQHPGYSLFDSKLSDFTAPKMAPKRDLIAEYVEACRKKGMRIGLYYSLLDWRYPAYFSGPEKDPDGWAEFLEYVHGQVRELCTNYGKIDIMWYDGGWPWSAEDWKAEELESMVRELQPDMLLNSRAGLPGDFDTKEQYLPPRPIPDRMWEACMTMNDHWSYSAGDRNWKTIRQLIHSLVQCSSIGGNLLLDVGPKPDGTFPAPVIHRLKAISKWIKVHGESIYGTSPCPLNRVSSGILKEDSVLGLTGLTTAKGKTMYLHILDWPGRQITIANLKTKILSGRILTTGQEVKIVQDEDRAFLKDLPSRAPDPYDSVMAIELDGEAEVYPDFRFIE